MKEVFGGYKVFDVFGMCVSYPGLAVLVLAAVAAAAALGAYRGQKSRAVA